MDARSHYDINPASRILGSAFDICCHEVFRLIELLDLKGSIVDRVLSHDEWPSGPDHIFWVCFFLDLIGHRKIVVKIGSR
jgi:hypothetical protein